MCILFYFSIIRLHEYTFAIHSMVHCKSAFEPGASLPGFLITAPPSVLVPAVLGALAVWILNQKKKVGCRFCGSAFEPGASGLPYYCTSLCSRSCYTWRARCVDSNPKKKLSLFYITERSFTMDRIYYRPLCVVPFSLSVCDTLNRSRSWLLASMLRMF